MKTVQIKIDDNVHRKAKLAAYKTGLTLAEFSRRAIQDSVRLQEKEPRPDADGGRLK